MNDGTREYCATRWKWSWSHRYFYWRVPGKLFLVVYAYYLFALLLESSLALKFLFISVFHFGILKHWNCLFWLTLNLLLSATLEGNWKSLFQFRKYNYRFSAVSKYLVPYHGCLAVSPSFFFCININQSLQKKKKPAEIGTELLLEECKLFIWLNESFFW